MHKRLKGTSEEAEFKPLSELAGEIIDTLGDCSCSDEQLPWECCGISSLPEHSPLAARRFQSLCRLLSSLPYRLLLFWHESSLF